MEQSSVILDKAIELALQSSWESFSLTDLADSLELNLAEVKECYRSKDDMAEAIFDRADKLSLQKISDRDFRQLSSDEKLVECIMTWFEYLSPIKPLIKEILAYKLTPGHFHLQGHGITRISRTVQWFLAAADRNFVGLKRSSDEIAVTSVFLTSFSFFLIDKSRLNSNTRALLSRLIQSINLGYKLASGFSRSIPFSKKSGPHSES